jgi:hypothetical protein
MTTLSRRPRTRQGGAETLRRTETPAQKKASRPPSITVNLRLPVDLLARLDHYIDGLETRTGLKAKRETVARWAFAVFLEMHAASADHAEEVRENFPPSIEFRGRQRSLDC